MQKQEAFKVALSEIKVVSKITLSILHSLETSKEDLRTRFIELFKMSLWSNRCDLSLSNGSQMTEEESLLSNVKELDSCLLADDSGKVFELLDKHPKKIIGNLVILE